MQHTLIEPQVTEEVLSEHNGTILILPNVAAGEEWGDLTNASEVALQAAGRHCGGRDASAEALRFAITFFLDLARLELNMNIKSSASGGASTSGTYQEARTVSLDEQGSAGMGAAG